MRAEGRIIGKWKQNQIQLDGQLEI